MINSDTRKLIQESYRSGNGDVIQNLVDRQIVTEQEAVEAIQIVFNTVLEHIKEDGKCCSLKELIDYVGNDNYFVD